MQPKEIHAFLNEDVLGQEEALRFVSVAIFKHLQGERFGNLMLIGNSGTGKTTVMRAMERFYKDVEGYDRYRVVVIINANTFATEDGGIQTTELFQRLEDRARRLLGEDASPEAIGR
ncbi:MAG: Clp protease, partial [Planctomycetota bacterium]|nr:Clp protease [Planctomycetota bacterium]